MRMTKSAKAFLEHFATRNTSIYHPMFKKDLASELGLSVEELGSVCIRLGEAYAMSTPPFSHLPPHEQRLMDAASAITLGLFMGLEFNKFTNPPKEKKN